MTSIDFDSANWRWTREPPTFTTLSRDTIAWTCAPKSDFWRHTSSGVVAHDGHAYVTDVAGDFLLEAHLEAALEDRYDQIGLMAVQSETVWVKAGAEFEQEPLVGAVATNGRSDWSFGPGSAPLTMRFERRNGTLEISAKADGEPWRMIRQLFLDGPVGVGAYSCAPTGSGFESRLSGLALEAT